MDKDVKARDTGGPAFPHQFEDAEGHPRFKQSQGMTLRDYFAGQALAGFMANTKRPTTYHPDDAAWAYQIADVMLAERAKAST